MAYSAWAAGGGSESNGSEISLPDHLPIASQMELASWAKARVVHLFQYSGSYGPVVPGGKQNSAVSTNNPDIRIISGLLCQDYLAFQVTLPEQQMYLGVSAMDGTGHQLFSGQNNFNLIPAKGTGWVRPEGVEEVGMVLSDLIYIPAPGAVWANVWKDGVWHGLRADGGGIYFPKTMCVGTNGTGILTISARDGTGKVYDMATGIKTEGESVNLAANVSISGLTCLDDPGHILDEPISVKGKGHRGWYQVKITSTRDVSLYGVTTEGEVAIAVIIRRADPDAEQSSYEIVPKNWTTERLKPGVYDIWFEYPVFDQDVFVPWWYWYGGMG